MSQIVQLVGAVLVLSGFALLQFRVLDATAILYLAVNALGAAILASLALHERQWGFLLLEAVWAAVSLVGLAGALGRPRAGARP